jgi:hypothetical protein
MLLKKTILYVVFASSNFKNRTCHLESYYDKDKFATFDADDTEASTFYPTGKKQQK